jgi:sulfatase modifying factor 1
MYTRWMRVMRPRAGMLPGTLVDGPGRRHVLGALAASLLVLAAPGAFAEERLDLDLGNGVSLPMVRVPAGTFTMGSPPGEEGRKDDESAHEVTLTQDFYIGDAPVTRGQFARFVAETGYQTEAEVGTSGGHGWNGKKLEQSPRYTWKDPGFPQTDDHPVVIVTYEDALAFARWLSARSGREVTLPTEAQWEYAARGGSPTPWFSADSSKKALALGWFKEQAGNGTHEVRLRPANGFGLYDVAGNVWEWCLDWYGPYPSGAATDPMIAAPPAGDTPRRVLRGGSWLGGVDRARSAARYRNTPGSRNADNGFRVVASVAAPQVAAAQATPPAMPGEPSMSGTGDPAQGSTDTGTSTTVSGGFGPGAGALALLGGLGVAGAVLVVGGLGRRRRRAARGSLSTRPGDDGFWIDTPLPPGTRVRWSARLGNDTQSGTIEATGGPLFVYTGQRPRSVDASVIAAGSGSSGGSSGSRGPGFPHHRASSPDLINNSWQQDEQARATMAAALTHRATHDHSSGSSSSGSSSEPFGGWPSAY